MNKSDIRKKMLQIRNNMDEHEKQIRDNKVFSNIINSNEYKSSTNIFLFVSYNSEVDTHKIIRHSLKEGKRIFVPKVISRKDGMETIEIKGFSDLEKSKHGILEPCSDKYANPEVVDVVFAPGLAFDKNGGRLGYGAGFYDRYLKLLKKSTAKIGLCYSFQVVENVPMEEYDVRMNGIITD
ncbi:5-formyltetrahydrofolate cyclo-ligase [Clostridium guangxiense]|uniref:5-formyltetrahydrofolate cyclo-ligase n=1 Tax=Clostridium guangxiense TaxID=1662055 RepID=UPI001E2E1A42|nr:5-formyltetrahydrofolate cyclo-ligase [Clostridium guangxiense]MCD2348800.1 5-formyltetrahydrofolate cyclo-ligase [Clostridium guangxiense]